MAKEPLDLGEILPDPGEIVAEAQNVNPGDELNLTALRRGKIRELMRLGYENHQIFLILDKGIKIGADKIIKVPISEDIIKRDMEYIRQEGIAADPDFAEKRAEILDKYRFLYQRAITDYISTSGPVKNSFLNTATSILNKIAELEGVRELDRSSVNEDIVSEMEVKGHVKELQELDEDARTEIIDTIRKISKERKSEGA